MKFISRLLGVLMIVLSSQNLFLNTSVLASPAMDIQKDGLISSSYDKLIRRLDKNYFLIKNALLEQEHKAHTVNEVEDFDYYMDQRAVQRAWSRDRMKKHEQYMNTHFVKLATENMKMVLSTAKCEYATRRCLDVNKMDLGNNKNYWPNCAIVHKCGHDSGCCKYPGHVCSPVESENIELYFFSIEQKNEKNTGRVERLTFENHTRCDCRPIPDSAILFPKTRNCACPNDFFTSSSSTNCECDCDRKLSKMCKRVKRGKRSYPSKGCKGNCSPPKCDYGEYKTNFRRCPRKANKGRRLKE